MLQFTPATRRRSTCEGEGASLEPPSRAHLLPSIPPCPGLQTPHKPQALASPGALLSLSHFHVPSGVSRAGVLPADLQSPSDRRAILGCLFVPRTPCAGEGEQW